MWCGGLTPSARAASTLLGVLALSPVPLARNAAQATAAYARVLPTVSLGTGILEFDPSGDQPFRGYAARAGVELNHFLDVTLTGQFWADLEGLRGRAIHLEGLYYPMRRPRVAPYVLIGIGHFGVSRVPGSTRGTFRGRATAFGLGLHARVWGAWGLRVEGLVRIDDMALDDELRGFIGYAPAIPAANSTRPPPQVTPALYWMVPVAGPWRFVEPAYALKFATPFSKRGAAALTMALVHWHIPSSFDTRAVLIMPGARWSSLGPRLYAQAGPLVSVMVEGPDDGVRGGLQFEVGGRLVGGRVAATCGLGWMWLSRAPDPVTRDPGRDQHGLLAHVGIGF